MKMSHRGRKTAIVTGALLLAVLVAAVALRERIWAWYLETHWKKIDAVALDDCDPDFLGAGPHGDGIRFLDSRGKEILHLTGFNNCVTVGSNHGIALDPERFRIYLREIVSHRVTGLDSTGRVVFKVEDIEAEALAVDPLTGNLWCLSGPSLSRGRLLVFTPSGKGAGVHAIVGHDIAYSPHDQTFWLAGYEIQKCDRQGRVLVRVPKQGWARVSIAPDPRDGGAWVAEREHPNVKGSENRLLRLDAGGTVVKEVPLGARSPFCVACDPETGTAWVADFNNSLLRVPLDGPPLEPLMIPAVSVTISPQRGSVWVGTRQALFRLGKDGTELARCPLDQPSSQSWLLAR
jgi:hypothetical protein